MSHPRAPSLIRSTPCRSIPHPPRRCRQCIGEESMERGIWFDHSWHPPTLPPIDGAVPPPDWILLDILAYFDGRRNDTTADALTRASDRIQVTFWAAPPPHVSYVGVHCPGLEPSRFGTEPEIMTTDEDLALLRIAICPEHGLSRQSSYDYFVYRARGSEREKPALLRLPNPTDERRFSAHQVGLLRCRNDDNGRFRFLVAALVSTGVNGRYSLYLFDSSTWEWKSKQVYLSSPQEGYYNIHLTSKVITLGEGGLMGWVDLWRGILLCDLLAEDPVATYIKLPPPLFPNEWPSGCPDPVRDIIAVNGCIKFFEMHDLVRPGPVINGTYVTSIPAGWISTTWSRELSCKDWSEGSKLKASDIQVHESKHLEFLPKLQGGQGTSLTLEQLQVPMGLPSLSLHDDGVVYLMAMEEVDDDDRNAWVLDVNTKNKALQGVTKFGAERTDPFSRTYLQSGISKHFCAKSSSRCQWNDDKTHGRGAGPAVARNRKKVARNRKK